MKHLELDIIYTSIPYDVALKIVSLLPARDVCVLGSCSKFWKELCGSDSIWVALIKERWPSLNLSDDNSNSVDLGSRYSTPNSKEWKSYYITRHLDMAGKTSGILDFVEHCSSSVSLEARDYLKAIGELDSMQLEFKDVESFLFKPELNVLSNLVALHYCIDWLKVPLESVQESLQCFKIDQRQVSVKWWKLGQWLYGFRQRDESHYRLLSLADLAEDHHEVLGVLKRGAVYEVMRVQISVAIPRAESWACQSSV